MDTPIPDPKPIPEAISFRQLATLLEGAAPDRTAQPEDGQAQLEQLERLLEAHARLGRNVLELLERHSGDLQAQRTGAQLMALGALGAHIRMGLHALAASRA